MVMSLPGSAAEPRLVGQAIAEGQAAHDRACDADKTEQKEDTAAAPNQDPHPAQGRPGGRQV